MRRLILPLFFLCCLPSSYAATPQPKPQFPTSLVLTQGTQAQRFLSVPNQVCSQAVQETRTSGVRRFKLLNCAANGSYVQFPENGGPIYSQWVYAAPPPVCTPMPAPLTRAGTCPAGMQGAWMQTATYAAASPQVPPDGCWTLGPYLPTDPPQGACQPVVVPPTGDIDLSYVDKTGAAYATFKAWVNSCLSNNSCYQFLPTDAAFMARLDGGAQYCAKAISDADRYATRVEQAIAAGQQPNFTGDPQGMDGLSGDSYLAVGPRVRDLAIVQKWCPNVTASQKQRWTAIITQAVFNVWNPTMAAWGGRSYPWSGWTVTPPNPGNNYYYSFTQATQMYEWVTGDLTYHGRTWPVLTAYFATIPTGGSEEGTGYGTSHKGLFEDVRWQRDIFGENYVDAHLTNSALYWTHAIMPDGVHFAAIGDQSRTNPPAVTDYQRALLAQVYATTTDATAKSLASYTLHRVTPAQMTSTYDYRDGLLATGNGGAVPSSLCYLGQSTGDLFCRTDWTASALWVGFRAGKYDQSHAHQDQGAFQLFYLGNWLAADANIGSHSGIQQDVTNNATLRFVKAGAVLRQAYNSTSSMTVTGADPASGVHAVANLAPAAGAAVTSWQRKLDFVGRSITITDTYAPTIGYAGIFQVSMPTRPTISGKTATAGAMTITVVSPADAVLSAVDWTTFNSDYLSGWRLDVSSATNTGYVVTMTVN